MCKYYEQSPKNHIAWKWSSKEQTWFLNKIQLLNLYSSLLSALWCKAIFYWLNQIIEKQNSILKKQKTAPLLISSPPHVLL